MAATASGLVPSVYLKQNHSAKSKHDDNTTQSTRAALTTHKLEWLEPWGKLAELELKCSNRELVYVGNTNVTQSTLHTLLTYITAYCWHVFFTISNVYIHMVLSVILTSVPRQHV